MKNHRICERCWFDGPHGRGPRGSVRVPSQVSYLGLGRCCFCGGYVITGIFGRERRAGCVQLRAYQDAAD